MIKRFFGMLMLLAVATSGCSTDKKANAAQPAAAKKEGSVKPRPTVLTVPSGSYKAESVVGGGRLSGTVDFDGVLPRDSVIAMPPESGCGASVTDRAVDASGTHIGGAVVWITDIRAGKPLPLARRFELLNADCQLSPRVQAVFAPGTLNMTSEDVAMHRNRIINVATGETEAIAPFNDNGEVVPFDDLLNTTKQLEVTCDLHPWAKSQILVFDHPYFASSARNGSFSIDDIPPGIYTIKAWHPRLGVAEQTVTIGAGQPASVALKLGGTVPSASTAPAIPPAAADTVAKSGAATR